MSPRVNSPPPRTAIACSNVSSQEFPSIQRFSQGSYPWMFRRDRHHETKSSAGEKKETASEHQEKKDLSDCVLQNSDGWSLWSNSCYTGFSMNVGYPSKYFISEHLSIYLMPKKLLRSTTIYVQAAMSSHTVYMSSKIASRLLHNPPGGPEYTEWYFMTTLGHFCSTGCFY